MTHIIKLAADDCVVSIGFLCLENERKKKSFQYSQHDETSKLKTALNHLPTFNLLSCLTLEKKLCNQFSGLRDQFENEV